MTRILTTNESEAAVKSASIEFASHRLSNNLAYSTNFKGRFQRGRRSPSPTNSLLFIASLK